MSIQSVRGFWQSSSAAAPLTGRGSLSAVTCGGVVRFAEIEKCRLSTGWFATAHRLHSCSVMTAAAESSERKVLDKTNMKTARASPGGNTVSAPGGRGADDPYNVEPGAPVVVADTSECAQLRVGNELAAVEGIALQARLDLAEETAGQLSKLAEAAQAAIAVLRPKLAEAEAQIDRLDRERTAVAAELYRQTDAHEAVQVSVASLQVELTWLRAEITRLREGADQAASDARQHELVELELRGEIERLRRATNPLRAEVAALRRDRSAAAQVARELMAASTADLVAPQKPSQNGGARAAMLGFGRAIRARAS